MHNLAIIESIYEKALRFDDPLDVERFLADACPDEETRRQVEKLLKAHPRMACSFLEHPIQTSSSRGNGPSKHRELGIQLGTKIGPYTVRELIGEGGMGIVYVAEQVEPMRRKVALKVIKPGMDTREIIARFEVERQALAMLDHPNITRVLDAGVSETERPYFAMELVRGIPITEYCDASKLSLRGRLQLFQTTCDAIQHAHQKGIMHRDLKPSNVLVTQIGGQPMVKIIDFGLAKATGDQRLTDKTVYTGFLRVMGTPVYMSPEQVGLSGQDVDTRSDIYSLGVLLYELLTGTTPLDKTTIHEKAYEEVCRDIREIDAPKPSDRISTLANAERTTVSQQRQVDSKSLRRLLRGDLDRVVLKALQKDREQRYQTARELAADIRRYLDDKPVVAVSPSPLYILKKYAKRHRATVGSGLVIAVMLVVSTLVSGWLAFKANSAQLLATQAGERAISERDNAVLAKSQAEVQERRMRRMAYAADMSLAAREISVGHVVRAKELLDRHRPENIAKDQMDREDLRGWEWRYLWQFCRQDPHELIADLQGKDIARISVSHNGRYLSVMPRESNHRISVYDLVENEPVIEFPGRHPTFSPTEPLLAYWSEDTNGGDDTKGSFKLWDPVTRKTANDCLLPTSDGVRGMAFSANGETLAVSKASWADTDQNELLLVNISDGAIQSFDAPQVGPGAGYPFALSDDMTIAAHGTGGPRECYVRVIDLDSGNEIARLANAPVGQWVECLALSPDQKLLAVGHGLAQSTLQIWDIERKQRVAQLTGHMAYVRDVVFSENRELVSASADRTVLVWDLTDLSDIPEPRVLRGGHTGEVGRVLALPDGRLISAGGAGRVVRWDLDEERRLPSAMFQFDGAAMANQFRPDGSALITCHRNTGVVSEWTGDQFETRRELFRLDGEFCSVSLSRDATKLAIGYTNGDLELLDIERCEVILRMPAVEGQGNSHLGQFFANDRIVQVTTFTDGVNSKFLWDLQQNKKMYEWPRGRNLVSLDGKVGLFIDQGQIHWTNFGEDPPTPLPTEWRAAIAFGTAALSPSGRFLAARQSDRRGIQVWDLPARKEKAVFMGGFMVGPGSTNFSPDSKRLIAGGVAPASILMYDLESRQRVLFLDTVGDTRRFARFAANGNIIRAEDEAGVIYGWRAPSWEEISAFEAKH